LSSTSSKRTGRSPEGGSLLIGRDGARWVAVGELAGAHGVRGEARLRPFNPDSLVIGEVSEIMLVPAQGPWQRQRIDQARPHGPGWLVSLSGVTTPEAARALNGWRVAVRERDLPALGGGQYYCYELIGLEVVDSSGERIGTVSDVLAGGGNDLLVVNAGEKERLVPMVDRMVTAVDLARRRIVVHPVPGLFD
jgi:16S rRNA processing protein RimM